MQQPFAAFDAMSALTVDESMDKRREISPSNPNAAPKQDVERVRSRVAKLGIDWEQAVLGAGLSRATAYRFASGKASVASLRTLEEWVVKQESGRGLRTVENPSEAMTAWQELGERLMTADAGEFARILEGVTEITEATEKRAAALLKIFKPTLSVVK